MSIAFAERHFDLGEITLFGIEAGNGPALVFFHGITANAYVWLPVLQALSQRYRVFALDQRGHGRSEMPSGARYDARHYADDIAGLANALGNGKMVLVGHSLGARNAIVAASRHPELFSAVVAIDFTAFIEEDKFEALESRVAGGAHAFASVAEVESYLRSRYTRLPDDAIARRAQHGFEAGADGRLRPLADAAAMLETCRGLRADIASDIAALAVPTLLVRGADSAFVSPAAFERSLALRTDLSGPSALVIADADHYVHEERPGEVAAAIEEFVGVATSNREMRPWRRNS